MVNDSEARELSGDWNIHRAGRWILAHGPQPRGDQAGGARRAPDRAGAARSTCPAFPLENVFDPTGAGDAFAGGFMGYLARDGVGRSRTDPPRDGLRRRHGLLRGRGVRHPRLRARSPCRTSSARVRAFRDLTHVAAGGADRVSERQYAAAGVDLEGAEARQGAHRRAGRRHADRALASARSARSAAWSGSRRACGGPTLVLSTDGVGTKVLVALEAGRFDTVGEDLVNHSVNDILVHGATPIAFMDYIAGAELGVEQIAGDRRGHRARLPAHEMALAGGETAQMPGPLSARHTTIWPAPSSAWWRRTTRCTATACVPGDVLLGYASTGLHTNGYTWRGGSCSTRWARQLGRSLPDTGMTVGGCAARGAPQLLRGVTPVLAQGPRAGAHHRRRHPGQSGAGTARGVRGGRGPELVASCRRSSRCCSGPAASPPPRCATSSTSASA